ncbi:MAG: hypothetical protein KY459_15070 [Acidobacteria bacterium]|nr:hypothetical protein [Acidobacteriota bacterium]
MRARDNPLAAGRFDRVRYRFPDGHSMEELLARLRARKMRGALVGGEGRGKSTLLGEIGDLLIDEGYSVLRITLHLGESRLPRKLAGKLATADGRTAVLVDGAEQLSLSSWLRLRVSVRNAGVLLITSHREGLLPTILHCGTSPELLEGILDELAPDRPADFPSAEHLWRKHRGDLRQALFETYDAWARL